MKIMNLGLIQAFQRANPHAKNWLDNWVSDTRSAVWKTSHDIKQRYANVSVLGGKVVIFNVAGNKYRLEVSVAYNSEIVFVDWIGTHAEYTRRHK